MDKELTMLHEKVDQITTKLELIANQSENQERRSQEFEELKADLIPIGNQLVQLTINELEEIGTEFELEDLLYLLKRVLRNTQLILRMMDRFEALMGIADEIDLLGKQVFSTAVEALDRLEREGLFIHAREMYEVLSDADTLRDLNRALQAFRLPSDEPVPSPSLFGLLKEINKPETRTGIYRLLRMLQALGEKPREIN